MRFGLSALAILAAMALGISPASAANDSYTFAGLKWGSSPQEVEKALAAQGFKISDPQFGPRKEFVSNNAWGRYDTRDRGKRLIAKGLVAGEKLDVELVFGTNDALQRIIVVGPKWNGTMEHSDSMRSLANSLAGQLQLQFGQPAEKREPFGFVDTATWQPARDGSQAEFYVRATKGGIFFPGNETTMRLNFWNPRYADQGTRVADSDNGAGSNARVSNASSPTSIQFGPGASSF